jgi:hypothetical protein
MDSGKKLLMTMTGEMHQPVRLYYEVSDQAAVLKTFTKLRCLDDDQDNQRWVWLYHGEAKKLKFHTSYSAIPRTMRPIVLGYCRFPSVQDMYLDVRSCERATHAVGFFDRYLPRSIARVTHAAIVNRLFPATAEGLPDLEAFFAPDQVTAIDGEAILRRMAASLQTIQDPPQRLDRAFTFMEHQSHEHLPEVEKLPVHFYTDGIRSFETTLRLRQIVAFEHWRGHTECTLGEVIHKVTAGVSAVDLAP